MGNSNENVSPEVKEKLFGYKAHLISQEDEEGYKSKTWKQLVNFIIMFLIVGVIFVGIEIMNGDTNFKMILGTLIGLFVVLTVVASILISRESTRISRSNGTLVTICYIQNLYYFRGMHLQIMYYDFIRQVYVVMNKKASDFQSDMRNLQTGTFAEIYVTEKHNKLKVIDFR